MGRGEHGGGSSGKMEKPHFEDLDVDEVPWWTSKRFILAIICFFGFANLYSQRVNLSMAMVCMVNHSATDVHVERGDSPLEYIKYHVNDNTTGNGYVINIGSTTAQPIDDTEKCPAVARDANGTVSQSEQGTFVWTKKLQGIILGSFFWGYLFPQVPGGWLSEKFGAKKIIAIGMFPVAVLTILTPISAEASPWLLLAVRLAIGAGEAVMYPAAQALFSRWAAPWERSRLIGISYAGGQLGNAIAFPVSGLLCDYGFGGGWPSIFYVLGSCGFVWCIIWTIFVHDSPRESPNITEIERKYIEQAIGRDERSDKTLVTPWGPIFKSPAVWAIIVAHMCGNWGAYFILTSIPAYMKEVLKFDIKKNGLFTMLPYLCFWMCINIGGIIADFLIGRKFLSVVWTRKLFDTIGLVMPGLLMVLTGFMTCNEQAAAVALLALAMGFSGFQFAAHFVNHGDIAPAFAGTLFGISNVFATIPGILTPYVVAAVTPEKTREQWLIVFYISGAVHLFGAVFYFIFARGEVQPWALRSEDAPGERRKDTESALLEEKNSGGVELKRNGDSKSNEIDTDSNLLNAKADVSV